MEQSKGTFLGIAERITDKRFRKAPTNPKPALRDKNGTDAPKTKGHSDLYTARIWL